MLNGTTNELNLRRHLDETAILQGGDAITETRDDGKIVADEDVGQALLLAQVHQQVQDFLLDRYVERRGRLIQQQDERRQDQCAGDSDTLSLVAR